MNSIAIHPGSSSAFSSGTLRQKFALDLSMSANMDVDFEIADTTETFVARGLLCGLAISVPVLATLVGAVCLVHWIIT